MNNLWKQGLTVKAVFIGLCTVPILSAASLDLPTTPLVSGSAVDSNMMLLLDSSRSMYNVVEEQVDSSYSFTCDDANQLTTTLTITSKYTTTTIATANRVRTTTVTTDTTAASDSVTTTETERNNNSSNDGTTTATSLIYDGTTYQFGNGTDEYCFDNDSTYKVRLNFDWGQGATYTGSYLNWYFDVSTGIYTDVKEGTETRLVVAKAAAIDLINDLDNIRVGVAQFNEDVGATVLVDIDDVDTQRQELEDAINNLSIYGSTPLLEAVQDLGWYFSADSTEDLIFNNGEADEKVCSANEGFYYSDITRSASITPSKTIQQYWCQANFIVALTDGAPYQDAAFTDVITNYKDANDYDGTFSAVNLKRLNAVSAMYETDLRPDISEDDGTEVLNNVSTFLIGFADSAVTSSTLMSALAEAGGTDDFLSAENSEGLVNAFAEASQSIFATTASMSSIALNTTSLTADSVLYRASFNTSEWSGTFSAYELDDDGVVSETASWNAADKLDSLGQTADANSEDIYDRNIFTYNSDAAYQKGIVFNSDSFGNFSAALKADLYSGADVNNNGNSTSDEEDAKTLIKYIQGDTSNEGTDITNYRTRSSLLGDIVNSTSIYVGTPELSWPDYDANAAVKFGSVTESYSTFKRDNTDRDPVVYVGANDGMLHAFNANVGDVDAGEELFAYIPNILASSEDNAGLHYLSDTNYAHDFYVDAAPIVSDVYTNNAWRSILVGGLRAGGKGIFALDITDPGDFDSSDANAEQLVLWEFSSADDADFGYSYSEPTIAKMANGKWAVIVGNGYNNSGSGTAELFILFIEEGSDGSWEADDYIEINTEVGNTITPNGLSTPTVVDIDGDSVADYVYAGDLQGNMWVFDLTDENEDQWQVSYQDNGSPEPLFTAIDYEGQTQPITSEPLVASYNTGNEYELLVFFGTGQYLQESDLSDTDVMSYYGILDDGTSGKLRADLTVRTLLTDNGLRSIEGAEMNWETSGGWFFDLKTNSLEEGERVTGASTISSDVLFFNSYTPDSMACSYGGDSWFMSLDLGTGMGTKAPVSDTNGDGVIDDDDLADDGTSYVGQQYEGGIVTESTILGTIRYATSSTDELVEDPVSLPSESLSGTLSWEELINQ